MYDFDCYRDSPRRGDADPDYVRPDTFPAFTEGISEWEAFVEQLKRAENFVDGEDPLEPLRTLRRRPPPPTRQSKRPRLFVSHRQVDVQPALKVAYLACFEGFDYWLDVLSPNLQALGVTGPGTPYQQALATAGIIEMALLNCTHVIALITNKTRGSMWVPYEYGRVKDTYLTSMQAAAWLDPKRKRKNLVPEYLHLGPEHHDEKAVIAWLKQEVKRWPHQPVSKNCKWFHATPTYFLG